MFFLKSPDFPNGVSFVGLGTSSFGSRVSPAAARNVLAAALDLGVNFIDTAPPYGLGDSERIVGDFVRHHPGRVSVCTKVGLDHISIPTWKRALLPAGRLLKRVMKKRMHQGVAGVTLRSVPANVQAFEQSLDRSLEKLGMDCVDVLLLHSYPWKGLEYEQECLTFLEKVRRSGKARVLGISGSGSSVALAMKETPLLQTGQVDLNELRQHEVPLRHLGKLIQTHSVLRFSPAVDFSGLDEVRRIGVGGVILSTRSPAHLAEIVSRAKP